MSPEALYEAWREPPSLHWNEIINPVNRTPDGELDQTKAFVQRWNRVADLVNAEIEKKGRGTTPM